MWKCNGDGFGRLLQLVFFVILSEIFHGVLIPYGTKVAALLRSEAYTDVYGAMGLALALSYFGSQ